MTQADPTQIQRFKQQVREDWTTGAAAWRKWNRQLTLQSRAATEAIVKAAQPSPGMQVLDLASGTGEPALSLAEAVGSQGHVTATDLVPEMLTTAEESARQRGLTNLTFKPADAEDLPFPDQSFDAVTCRFGIMFFPDVDRALKEVNRVLKPGGRASFVAWGPLDHNPYFMATVGVFMKHVESPPPPPGAPTPFAFAKSGTLTAALHGADFRQIQEESPTVPWTYPGSATECWEAISEMTAPAFRRFFDALEPDRHVGIVQEAIDAIAQFYDGEQVKMTAEIVIGTGVR